MKQAKGTEYQYDIVLAKKMIKACSFPPVSPSLNNMSPLISNIFKSVSEIRDLEYSFQNPESPVVKHNVALMSVSDGAYARIMQINQGSVLDYSAIMAEMLDDFTPETVFFIMSKIAHRNFKAYKLCIVSAQYIVAHSTSVLQRDTARFLCLEILDGKDVKSLYPSVINMDLFIMSIIADIVDDEMARINHMLPQLIAYDKPCGTNRIKRSLLNIFYSFVSKFG